MEIRDLHDREEIRSRMNNSFSGALLSEKTDRIPDEYDWFAPLIGDWDCDYYDEPQPDGEYGTSLRMFNKSQHCYDVVYTCDHVMKRLCFIGKRL